jgi:propanol-preferring alcohol dehydrogenase
MRAAVVTSFGAPITITSVPTPEPGPGQLLVRLEASGLCHTDIHAARGDWPIKPVLPFVPGHEGVGVVEALGPGVRGRSVGDRVAVTWLASACGHCRYCVGGDEALCRDQVNSGYSVDGVWAEYVVVSAGYAVPVPAGLSPLDAAPLTCAGLTTYRAVKVARIGPAQHVAVFGIGGLGHLAVQYARLAGGFVTAVDVEAAKLDLASDLGADHVVNARADDPVRAIRAQGGADVALVLTAHAPVFSQALSSLRRGGRLVCVALPSQDTVPLPLFETVVKGLTVLGSVTGTRGELAEVFDLHRAGRTRVARQIRALDDANTCIDEVLAGQVPGRIVFAS